MALQAALAAAQSLPFKSYSADDGLAQSVVLTMAQDRDGYLWLGTAYGISRFDGLVFSSWDEHDGLASNVVRCVYEDPSGTLWVGTDEGLNRWAQGRWEQPVPELAGRSVRCLASTPDGALWAGTYGQGAFRLAGQDVSRLTAADGLAHDSVRAAFCDRQGRLWLGTFGGGVSRVDGGRVLTLGAEDGLGNLFVRCLAEDSAGHVLVGTNAGVYQWTGSSFVPHPLTPSLAATTVTSLLEDRRGRLWVGTRDQGACRVSAGQVECFGLVEGLADDSVDAILSDREGNLWFATFGGGVSRLSTESFRNFTTSSGLPPGGVTTFAELGGEIWIGTHGGGIGRLVGGRFEPFTVADGLPHDKVLCAWADADGTLWVGTLAGAARRRPGQRRFEALPGLLGREVVYHILVVGGSRWFATYAGLAELSATGERLLTQDDGLPGRRVNHVIPAQGGGLWVATEEGLARYRDGRFTAYTQKDGLTDDFIYWLHESGDGTLWVATTHGLNRLEDGRFRAYGLADGLSHELCSVILEDHRGVLWVGTTRGINVFDGQRFQAFTAKEGLPSSEVLPGAGFRDSGGRLWFGTVRGATVFEPGASPEAVPPPPVHVTGLEVEDARVEPVPGLSLPHDRNRLHFELVGISLTFPEEVRYRYRLEGLDERAHTTSSRSVTYPAVPPGRYTLRVEASHDGVGWSPRPAAVSLEIAPPVWQRWWFRALVVAALGAALLTGHRLRVRSLRQRERLLAALVDERTRELAESRDQLQRINAIVQAINTELDLPALLASVLAQVQVIRDVDRASALVWDPEGGRFRFVAATGCDLEALRDVSLSAAETEARYVAGTEEVDRDLFVLRDLAGRPAEERFAHLPRARSMLVLRVRVEGRVQAYLLLASAASESAFDRHDVQLLGSLREHIRSAFIKARVMAELKRLDAKKNEFLGIAAHDLRSPLGGVVGYADLLLRFLDEGRVDPALWRRFLGNLRTTAVQMQTLVNELLDVAAIETGRVEVDLARHRLAAILEEREALQQPAAARKQIELTLDLTAADAEVVVDRVRIAEVVDNLLANAVKYTQPGGRVRVWCELRPGELVTHVEDTGQGLAAAELGLLFSGRKLSARPTAGEPSTGLGLVIVRKLLELHGGRIWVASEKGRGSTFSFALPLADP